MKKEINIITPLAEFPDWTFIEENKGNDAYDVGYWTYSNNYVFLIYEGALSYRPFIDTEELDLSPWEWKDVEQEYTDKTIDPIIYVMEDIL